MPESSLHPDDRDFYERFCKAIGCDYRPNERGFLGALTSETEDYLRDFNKMPHSRGVTKATARERALEQLVEAFRSARADEWAVDWNSAVDVAEFIDCRRYGCIWAVLHGRASIAEDKRAEE